MIDLHYCGTPNGQKIAIMLEEVSLPYRPIIYDIFEGDHLQKEFGTVNPNHKVPAIVDRAPAFGGDPVAVFETGAILQYLAEKSHAFLPTSGSARWRVLSWLTWQVASMGPMLGQASHFTRYAPPGQDYAIERYTREMERLLAVLERQLSGNLYVAGGEYSVADMAVWPFVHGLYVMGVDLTAWPALGPWIERVGSRPMVRKALEREDLKVPEKYRKQNQQLSPREWSNMFGAAMHSAVRR